MPRRDGIGPMNAGAMTGRGFGICNTANAERTDSGFGMELRHACKRALGRGRGLGRGFGGRQASVKTQKQFLQEQKGRLQNRLVVIDKQLEDL